MRHPREARWAAQWPPPLPPGLLEEQCLPLIFQLGQTFLSLLELLRNCRVLIPQRGNLLPNFVGLALELLATQPLFIDPAIDILQLRP